MSVSVSACFILMMSAAIDLNSRARWGHQKERETVSCHISDQVLVEALLS